MMTSELQEVEVHTASTSVDAVKLPALRKASGGYVSSFSKSFGQIFPQMYLELADESSEDGKKVLLVHSTKKEDKDTITTIPTHQLLIFQAVAYAFLVGKGDTPEGIISWVSQLHPSHTAGMEATNPKIIIIPDPKGRNGASGFEFSFSEALATSRIRGPIFTESVVKYPAIQEERAKSAEKELGQEEVGFAF